MKYPKQIILEVTQRCNLKCKYCPNLTCDSAKDMPLELFKSIIDKIDTPDITVIPWMNGEPLLHPEYDKMLEYIGEKGLRAYITTNGMIYRDEVAAMIAKYNSVYQVIISLDGAFANTIKATRPGSDPRKVIDSVYRYMDLANHNNFEVAVKICERGQDWQEIETYIKHWLSLVDFVIVGKRLGQINEESMRRYPCQYFDNNFIVIRADGEMVPCAYHDDMVNKKAYPLGNIQDYDTVTAAYNNDLYRELRTAQNEKHFHSPCDKCSFAYTGSSFRGKLDLGEQGYENVFFHQDYYNQFYSLTDRMKPKDYYGFNE